MGILSNQPGAARMSDTELSPNSLLGLPKDNVDFLAQPSYPTFPSDPYAQTTQFFQGPPHMGSYAMHSFPQYQQQPNYPLHSHVGHAYQFQQPQYPPQIINPSMDIRYVNAPPPPPPPGHLTYQAILMRPKPQSQWNGQVLPSKSTTTPQQHQDIVSTLNQNFGNAEASVNEDQGDIDFDGDPSLWDGVFKLSLIHI